LPDLGVGAQDEGRSQGERPPVAPNAVGVVGPREVGRDIGDQVGLGLRDVPAGAHHHGEHCSNPHSSSPKKVTHERAELQVQLPAAPDGHCTLERRHGPPVSCNDLFGRRWAYSPPTSCLRPPTKARHRAQPSRTRAPVPRRAKAEGSGTAPAGVNWNRVTSPRVSLNSAVGEVTPAPRVPTRETESPRTKVASKKVVMPPEKFLTSSSKLPAPGS